MFESAGRRRLGGTVLAAMAVTAGTAAFASNAWTADPVYQGRYCQVSLPAGAHCDGPLERLDVNQVYQYERMWTVCAGAVGREGKFYGHYACGHGYVTHTYSLSPTGRLRPRAKYPNEPYTPSGTTLFGEHWTGP